MVHSEQMLALDGPIRIGKSTATKRDQIENHSKMDLHSVCVVETEYGAELEGRWIGDLLPGQSVPLTTCHLPADKRPFADERAEEAQCHQARSTQPRTNVPTRARSQKHRRRAKRGSSPASMKSCPAKRSRPPPRKSAARRSSSPTFDTHRYQRPKKTPTPAKKSKPPKTNPKTIEPIEF